MQRWIVIVALILALLGGGAVFGVWKYTQTRPDRSFLPLPFNAESSLEERQKTADDLRARLLTREILAGVARDCEIAREWKLPSEEAAVDALLKRAFVEAGEATLPNVGRVPTLNIGFRGIRSENQMLRNLSERLGQDLQKIFDAERPRQSPPPDEL